MTKPTLPSTRQGRFLRIVYRYRPTVAHRGLVARFLDWRQCRRRLKGLAASENTDTGQTMPVR